MHLVDVSVETSGYDPRSQTYRHTYRRGIAVCQEHGPYEGWTTDLDIDEPVVWIEWRELRDHDHPDDCRCWWCLGQPRPIGYEGVPSPFLPENRVRRGGLA